MGGTGLEPVTPSLSIGATVRARSLRFAQPPWFSGIRPATERLSERERTLILAILATLARSAARAVHLIYSFSCYGCFVFVDETAEEVAPADLGD